MTKEEFKKRWESDDNGGGITYEDIAKCAIEWGISNKPKTHDMFELTQQIVKAAGC